MNLNEQIEKAFLSALEKLGIRQGEVTPPPPAPATEETQTAADSRLAALEQQNAELLKRAEEAEKQASLARQDGEKAALLERNERAIEALKTSFRVTAATGDALAQLAEAHPEAFGPVLNIFQKLEPMPQLSGGRSGDDARAELENQGGDADADRLHHLALARAKETGERYAVALSVVSRENPQLAASVAAPKTYGVVNDAEDK